MHKAPTKQKGDIGLTQIVANLELHGIKSALPIADHLPFDLIAINKNAKLSRISIKYRELRNGIIRIPLTTVYSNRNGAITNRVNLNEIDAFAVYCAQTKKCYYISVKKVLNLKTMFCIRVDKINEKFKGDKEKINWASDYENPQIIFGE